MQSALINPKVVDEYLAKDDFLNPTPWNCGHNLQLLIAVCQGLGIPLAVEKVEGPSTNLKFLGIQLDTVRMEARLPEEKLHRISNLVQEWLPKRNAREVLSLVLGCSQVKGNGLLHSLE